MAVLCLVVEAALPCARMPPAADPGVAKVVPVTMLFTRVFACPSVFDVLFSEALK